LIANSEACAPAPSSPPSAALSDPRPTARGKFLFAGDEKLYVRGVTYGAFRPDEQGNEYHRNSLIERDFAQMAAMGVNAVRIPHTTPPRSLLDAAHRHGLRVMVGLSAEQYVGFLIDRKRKDAPDIEEVLRARVRSCAGHPAVLCYALGNEVPGPIVRWLGPRRVERFLERMYRAAKDEDPEGLVTYVNYPTTEYLRLPFLDLLSVNVYLESPEQLRAYLARLHNIAGDRPLLMSEVGLDSLRNGKRTQARVLDWQLRTARSWGCAGVFVFSWTDEWFRGGEDVDDWEFGLTDAQRKPKAALAAVRGAFRAEVLDAVPSPPRVSVVVCSHNGSRTIAECCEGLRRLEYPDFEVIVVDDGSSDTTASIASGYGFRVIRTEHRGLSHARNTGMHAATGEIVAYIDDDAYPEPDWLVHLAATFSRTEHVGVGGPNLSPVDDPPVAQCVDNSPGNPTQVLITDEEADHIPGCNMAFRKSALEAIRGFDTTFRTAGDDVDVCWRLHERGWTLGFSPAAVVWHHRRSSVRAYLLQQVGYGMAETLLARKWRKRRNWLGHWSWRGRIYGAGQPASLSLQSPRIYHGLWGSAPFQSIYEPAPGLITALLSLPELHLFLVLLAGLAALGSFWSPLLLALPLLGTIVGALSLRALVGARQASFPVAPGSWLQRAQWTGLTALLHLLQPIGRLRGRLRVHLERGGEPLARAFAWPWPRTWSTWSEEWLAPERRLASLEESLRARAAPVARGGEHDRWDLEIPVGVLGSVRGCMACEDHGGGQQLVRFRTWPRVGVAVSIWVAGSLALAVGASVDGAWPVAAVLGLGSLATGLAALDACGRATAVFARALEPAGSAETGRRP
jgi:cellulose synthase/poly-beta-1,6-N-acetylglucosamine synthase-like glycosyltransferase